MATGAMQWFRWHHGSASDPKFKLVAKKVGCSTAEVIAVWACILEAASASDDRGSHGHLDYEAIDLDLGLPDGRSNEIYLRMQDRGLVDGEAVCSWEKRQPKREDETANDRKRRQREREHELRMAGAASRNVTQCHADVTHGHARGEERREEEIREEEIQQSSPVNHPAHARDDDEKPKTPAEWIEVFAEQHGVDVDHRSFHDRKKFWPLAAAWTNAGVTVGQMRVACAKAHDEAKEPIAWLPAYADRVLASTRTAPRCKAGATEPAWRTEQRERTMQAVPGIAQRVKNSPEILEMEAKNVTAIALG